MPDKQKVDSQIITVIAVKEMLPDGFLVMQVWVRHLEMSFFYYEREQE